MAQEYVDPYPGRTGSERITVACGSCSGTGLYAGRTNISFHAAAVGHVAPGCFSCMGSGKRSFLVSSARSKARRHAKQAAEREANAQAARHALDLFLSEHAELLAQLADTASNLRDGDPLQRQASELALAAHQPPDDIEGWLQRSHAVLVEVARRTDAERPAPIGKQRVQGTILVAKYVDSDYGSRLKMLVEGDGWKVWGSVPKNISDNAYEAYCARPDEGGSDDTGWSSALIGREISFNASFTVSDDPSFGFFTRPTKAEISDTGASA